MKKVLTVIVWLGLGWSLLTMLGLMNQRTDLRQEVKNAQRKYDALKILYDQAKEDYADQEAAWQEKSEAWEALEKENETLRKAGETFTRENEGLKQENEALRRETAALVQAQDQAQREWEAQLRQLSENRDQAERRLNDVLALLLPAAEETAAEPARVPADSADMDREPALEEAP